MEGGRNLGQQNRGLVATRHEIVFPLWEIVPEFPTLILKNVAGA